MNTHEHMGIETTITVGLFVILVSLFLVVTAIVQTIGTQSDRDARRIDHIEQQLNIPGPDVPTPDILGQLHALQTEVAK